jgi:quercetin dioxygenase-like cupin family protein
MPEPRYEVIDRETLPEISGYAAPFCVSQGIVRSRFSAPEGFGQFVLYADLDAGAEVEWNDEHGDEGIFVLAGEVEVDGKAAPAKGGAIVESNAKARLRAKVDSRLLHLGSTVASPPTDSALGAPDPNGHGVHVYDASGKAAIPFANGIINNYFADSHCPTCRISLFRVSGPEAQRTESHSHSVHELITVTEGELQVGRDVVRPLMTLAIPRDRRYGFRAKPHWEFVNFRLDASYFTKAPGSTPILEGIEAGATTS